MTLPILGEKAESTGPMMRVLLCTDCNSIDELPPHAGAPENDVVLERLIADLHTHPVMGAHRGLMFTVPVKHWANETARKAIIKQMREGLSGGLDEIDPDFYASRDNFRDDAMACWAQHLRPKGQCPDYMSESKKILPPTREERKELDLAAPKDSGVSISQCSWCPVHVYNITKRRSELGMYK